MSDPAAKPRVVKIRQRVQVPSALWSGADISRLYTAWSTSPRPIDEDIKAGLRALRARSREQAQNNDWVRRFLKLVGANVVGYLGVQLQAKALAPDGKPDRNANRAVEEAWKIWGAHGSPEVTGLMSWRQFQRLVVESVARDGEVLIRKIPGWKRNEARFALDLIDPEFLDVGYTTEERNGNKIQMGVELDTWRRPIAYHIRTAPRTTKSYQASNGHHYLRIPAEEIYHVYLPEWIWQTRAVPWIASSLLTLKMLDGYQDAELVAARTAAARMGFFTQAESDAYSGEGEDDEGNLITSAVPGTFERLPPGVDFKPWDPQHPSTAYPDFVKAQLRSIASGLGITYNSLANDLEGVNYSSLRQGAIEERAVWRELQSWFEESCLQRIYDDWLASALQAGAVRVGQRQLAQRRYDQLRRVRWMAPRWPWVDPEKDLKAAETAIRLKLRSRSEIIREQGRDPEEVWQEIAEEERLMRELGVPDPIQEPPNDESEDDDQERTDA